MRQAAILEQTLQQDQHLTSLAQITPILENLQSRDSLLHSNWVASEHFLHLQKYYILRSSRCFLPGREQSGWESTGHSTVVEASLGPRKRPHVIGVGASLRLVGTSQTILFEKRLVMASVAVDRLWRYHFNFFSFSTLERPTNTYLISTLLLH